MCACVYCARERFLGATTRRATRTPSVRSVKRLRAKGGGETMNEHDGTAELLLLLLLVVRSRQTTTGVFIASDRRCAACQSFCVRACLEKKKTFCVHYYGFSPPVDGVR